MATSPLFGWEEPDDVDLVKDGAAAIRTLGNAIDTSMGDLLGGTTGQVLSKASNANMDFAWVAQDDSNAIQNAIVDAKGDLIAASAADTPARLAVGNNGETLVADSSTSVGIRYQATKGRNVCYNSGFQIWQRGTSFTVPTASGEYTADRWYAAFSGISGRTLSRQTGTSQFPYLMRVARDSGNSATNALVIGQSWEIADATPYAGQTITISYYARKGANYSATSDALTVNFYTGTSSTEANRVTTGYASGDTALLSATTTLTSTLTRYTHTVTLGSTVTQFGLRFTFTPTGTAGAADYYEITGVQVEVGSVATTWNTLGGTIQGELAACQRYYWRSGGDNAYQYYATGVFASTTSATLVVKYPTTMRVAPTSMDYSTLWVSDGTNNFTLSSFTAGFQSKDWARIDVGVTGATQYRPALLFANNSTSAYLGFSAEL